MMNEIDLEKRIWHLRRENNARRQNAVTFSCLGKLGAANSEELDKWKTSLQGLIRESLNEKEVSRYPLIIGLAESGIVPSALFHQILREKGIHAEWICSTRRPSPGIHFRETHSHGPDHTLPVPCRQPTEIWFVEDEITTGRTVLTLALNLCEIMNVRQVRFFAIADLRDAAFVSQFRSVLQDHGICHSTHALVRPEPPLGESGENGNPSDILSETALRETRISTSDNTFETNWCFPHQRPALRNQLDVTFPFDSLPNQGLGRRGNSALLVVGEAVDIGLRLVQANPCLSFRHLTLSPWQIDGEHISTRLDICGTYYLYNYHELRPPIRIVNDPIDSDIGMAIKGLLAEKGVSSSFVRFL